MHGYAIAQTIHLLSDEVLRVEEGSLYPALDRLEVDGAISANWGASENNRKAKYYKITAKGRKAIASQQEMDAAVGGRRPRSGAIERKPMRRLDLQTDSPPASGRSQRP